MSRKGNQRSIKKFFKAKSTEDFEVLREAENVENLSNQDAQEIASSKFLANSVANISANAKSLEETKNKTALDQENLDFEASREAENVENLSNQDDQEISFSVNSAANTSTNGKELEKTRNKRRPQELPNSNKLSKLKKLTRPQVALNCETLAALGKKRKLKSAERYAGRRPDTVSQYCLNQQNFDNNGTETVHEGENNVTERENEEVENEEIENDQIREQNNFSANEIPG